MNKDIEEVKKDLKEALKNIDFKNYDPMSKMFERTLNIGLMLMNLITLENTDDVKEELDGAENYFETYLQTNDVQYKEMANDELKHAGILIKKHLAKTSDEKQKEKLNQLENERQEMLKEFAKNLAKQNETIS